MEIKRKCNESKIGQYNITSILHDYLYTHKITPECDKIYKIDTLNVSDLDLMKSNLTFPKRKFCGVPDKYKKIKHQSCFLYTLFHLKNTLFENSITLPTQL